MKLTSKQTTALNYLEDQQTNEIIFGGGAGGGKSALGVYWIIKNCLRYKGSRWLIGRAVLKTLKDTTLNSFYDICKLQGLRNGVHFKYNAQSNIITFSNGSTIYLKDLFLYPSDPNFDELGSLEISGAFIDECNQVTEKAFNIVKSRIRYKLNDFNIIPKILGTCNPSKGFVYNNFYKPSKEGKLPNNKAFIQALATDNSNISLHYIESLKTLDNFSKERLLYGNWEYDDSKQNLIQYDKIVEIYSNELPEGKQYISADIARFGKDKTIVMLWNGLTVTEIHRLAKKSTTEVAEFIKSLAAAKGIHHNNIIIDEDGIGGGTVDQIKGCKGFLNGSKAIKGNYINLKSECYYRLAELINKNEIAVRTEDIDIRKQLTEELEWVHRHNADKDGKLAILPKEKVKEKLGRSPDISDALMMRIYFELKPFDFVVE